MFRRIRRRRTEEPGELHRQHYETYVRMTGQVPPEVTRMQAAQQLAESAPMVDDFLPAELRVPGHDQLEGRMMPWPWPIVLNGKVVACSACGAYRNWLILSTRDQVWLRCRAGHQQHEARLDTAWYNRHAGPADAHHETFEDCLRHLGH